MWGHYCEEEKSFVYTCIGQSCSWCGKCGPEPDDIKRSMEGQNKSGDRCAQADGD